MTHFDHFLLFTLPLFLPLHSLLASWNEMIVMALDFVEPTHRREIRVPLRSIADKSGLSLPETSIESPFDALAIIV